MAKLDFPRYAGNDPTEWFNRINQFFEYQESIEDQKFVLASFHLEGEANQWWQWLRRSYQEEGRVVTWEIFVEELWARFGPTDCKDFDEARSRIKQTSTLRDYQKEFESLGNRVQGWTQKALVGTFMGGLKLEISEEIRLRSKPLQNFSNRASPAVPFKKLSWEEMQRRKAQGLCFTCNEKFTIGHKCSKAQLLILESEANSDEESTEATPYRNGQDEFVDPEITLYALTGWAILQTMRVMAKIGPYEILVWIDNGSTHNFINTRLANMLQLPFQPIVAFSVKVANGEKVTCQGKHEKVQVLIQDVPFELTLYSLCITGLDMVLGVQWLEKLRSVVCNWKTLTMDFKWNNERRWLQGMGPQTIQATSLTEIIKEMRHGHSVFAICLQINKEVSLIGAPASMQNLLEEYVELFQEPNRLPPTREIDHHITLKEWAEPINVRPYRYAYFQKAEIEKQVHEMLNSGLIRQSTSPFSSPVLLVKKNGSWRFCTDYRSLNEVTVKDRFPIPTVEDMLDELHGAAYFTKLDLRASPTWSFHFKHVRQAFEILKQQHFFVKGSKCNFDQQELEYFRHIVTCHGVKVGEKKIAAMVSWPQPHNISELRGFLGLTGYFRKFVRGYGLLARPLTNLLKKGQFSWNKDAEEAFVKLKQAMTKTPVLSMPNFNDKFIIETDASGDGIRAVLQQNGKPIALMSQALGVSKKTWSTYAKELLVVVEAVRMWRPYLLGHRFVIQTDQCSLKYLLEHKIATPE
ncbi:hypothetical protein KPL71_022207 [Citrus sinensis]|uniref:Uncharacterized protein n=1 Tax=Citrus sinensis TaxID=2711 RepID=A0ACB8JKF6_CITSI|nr:hypothetical protein KPL71_022207 [Citrus sinensis]